MGTSMGFSTGRDRDASKDSDGSWVVVGRRQRRGQESHREGDRDEDDEGAASPRAGNLCSAGACRGRCRGCRAWRTAPGPSRWRRPTRGTRTSCCTSAACSSPRGTRRCPGAGGKRGPGCVIPHPRVSQRPAPSTQGPAVPPAAAGGSPVPAVQRARDTRPGPSPRVSASPAHHAHQRRHHGPAPLHEGQGPVADHAGHVVHEAVGACGDRDVTAGSRGVPVPATRPRPAASP